jgi:2-methylcitrate dehydratase PrpD
MDHILSFIHDTTYGDLPADVKRQAQLCTLDLIGSLAGGRQTRLSAIINRHAVEVYGGDQATLLFDGQRCSAPGAALANGMSIDSLDIHDSHRESLGHAGVHVFPTILAVAEQLMASKNRNFSGADFLTALAIGYDIACRAGVVLHATVSDYHTSGAWGAVSSAALFSRLHGLATEQTRHALGIAEYHGPRSQMMRVIDHPTMLKDGSGWGAMAGVSAGMLAAKGFTGAPAITLESPEAAGYWADLGQRWLILEQGFKVHAVCWWAQPAIEASLQVVRKHRLAIDEINQVEVHTFEKATHLDHPRPATSEEAQYSLTFPVAAALHAWAENGGAWFGLGPEQLLEAHLSDARVLSLAERVKVLETADLSDRFPEKFLARVVITLTDGRAYQSGDVTFRGELDHPLSDEQLLGKFRWLAGGLLPAERVAAIEAIVRNLPDLPSITPLSESLTARAR